MYTETNFKILNIEIQKKTNTKQKNLSKKKEEFNKTKNPKIKQNKQKTTAF